MHFGAAESFCSSSCALVRGRGEMSMRIFSASSRNCWSLMVASNAERSVASGSAGSAGGALKDLLADHELDHFALVLALDVFEHRGDAHAGELGVGLEANLQQQVDLAVAQPVRALRLEARPVPAAGAVDLAALHGERDLG